MGSRNVLTVLIVVFVAVLLYNALYFTGVVGNYGQQAPLQPLPPDERFNVPGLNRENEPLQPRPSGVQRVDSQQAVAPRAALDPADLTIGSNWGRNPFLTPQEIRALDNFRPVYQTAPSIPPSGLYLSAVMLDSSGRRIAIINGDVYGVGDTVGGMQILDMWNDAVVFLLDGQRHVIRIGDPAIQLSSSRPGRY